MIWLKIEDNRQSNSVGMYHRRDEEAIGCARISRRERWWHKHQTVLQAGARWGSCGLLHQGKEQAE